MEVECKSCGEKAVHWEDSGSGEQQICRACGAICSDFLLVNDPESLVKQTESHNRYLGGNLQQYTRYQFTRNSESYNSGRKQVRCLSCALCLKRCLVEESLALFEQVFHLYIHSHAETKLCLASWCVYIVCRQAGLPITSHYVSQITGYPIHKLYQYHTDLLEKLGIKLKHQDVTELIETTLKLELASDIQCNCETMEKTRHMILLCKDLWLIDGRNPHAAIIAAFFLAWQSDDFTARKKTALQKICKRQSAVSLSKKRLSEFRDTLCKLASCIPWVSNVMTANLPYYINDVLKYQKSLVIDALRQGQCESHTDKELGDCSQTDPFLKQAATVAQHGNKETASKSKKNISDKMKNETSEAPSSSGSLSTEAEGSSCDKVEGSCSSVNQSLPEKDESLAVAAATRSKRDLIELRTLNIKHNFIFAPPAFKKARKKSLDCQNIQEYIEKSRAMSSDTK